MFISTAKLDILTTASTIDSLLEPATSGQSRKCTFTLALNKKTSLPLVLNMEYLV